jgi:hypothetical protein
LSPLGLSAARRPARVAVSPPQWRSLHDRSQGIRERGRALYKGLAAALARKWVTQSKWPADGWEFTFDKQQIKLMKDKK